jgi:MYXO-CTERM domain-containing protein
MQLLLLLGIAAVASATPLRSVQVGDTWRAVYADADPDAFDERLEAAAGQAPPGAAVQLWVEDASGFRRMPLPPPGPSVPDKEDWPRPPSLPVDNPGAAAGALSGRAVYLSQCHGFKWYDSLEEFTTQRGNGYDTVEDFHNPEGANQFLTRYLENAGAAVFTARERDRSPSMAISDNDGGGYAEVGSGFTDGPAGFRDASPWAYGQDPFDAGTTRRFPADGGGVAQWQPTVPAEGYYAVYVSWDSDPANATDAHYVIRHPGGVVERWLDQTVHGSTWQYVETLWLSPGRSLTVELVGDSGEVGKTLNADAVRIGGGLDDVSRHGEVTGLSRWQSAAIHYNQFNGAPTSVYDPYGDGAGTDDGGSDPATRSRWAEWEHPRGEDAVYVSWHSNATDVSVGGTARGTVTYFAGGGPDAPADEGPECASPAVEGSYDLSRAVQDELVGAFRAAWEPDWQDRDIGTACFSEVSPTNNDEMPATLVELAFHNNADDAAALKHPRFRRLAARAMYRGIVRYFAERDGLRPVFSPEPPTALAVLHEGDHLLADWQSGPFGGIDGDPADTWMVFTSADGRAWDSGTEVTGTSARIDTAPGGQPVFVRVAGINAGGIGFPSEVHGARLSPDGMPRILVVDAFDRLDAGQLDLETPTSRLGEIVRMDLRRMNPADVAAAHGRHIAAVGYYFDSVDDDALSRVALEDYDLVVWANGEESSVDDAVSADQQVQLRAFHAGGGALWVSGSEIFWDLDYLGDSDDRAFAEEVFGARMEADSSGSQVVEAEGLLAGLAALDFGPNAVYPVEWADVLASEREVIARYGTGTVAAVYGDGVATFGFPFETIVDPIARTALTETLLGVLMPGYTPPDGTWTGTGTGTGPDTGTPGGATRTGGPTTTGGMGGGDTTNPGGGPVVIDPNAPADSDTAPSDDSGGCGCVSGPSGGSGLTVLALFVALVRRRR